jgi:hypothetical protein
MVLFWYILIPIVQKGRKSVTFAIHVRTMWYEKKVSNFEIAVAKLKETLRNVKFATLCPERSVGTSLWPPKFKNFRSKYDSLYANFTPTLAYLWYLVTTRQWWEVGNVLSEV